MNIQYKNDYSYLFSGLSSSKSYGSINNSFLADYASIKNGSYLKLMKAYYGKNSADVSEIVSDKKVSTSQDSAKTLSTISGDADALQKSAEALVSRGSDSLFKKKETTSKDENGLESTRMDYDTDAIYKGVKAFVDDYNKLIDSSTDSNSTNILKQTKTLTNTTNTYKNLLGKMGITIGKDNKLSIDEKTFKASDLNTVKTVFNGTGSFAYNVEAKAAMIDQAATQEAKKANTYNSSGSYNSNYSNGSIYNSFF